MIITYALAAVLLSSSITFFQTSRHSQNIYRHNSTTEYEEEASIDDHNNHETYTKPTLSPLEKKQLERQAICDRENKRNEIDQIRKHLAKKNKF